MKKLYVALLTVLLASSFSWADQSPRTPEQVLIEIKASLWDLDQLAKNDIVKQYLDLARQTKKLEAEYNKLTAPPDQSPPEETPIAEPEPPHIPAE